MERKTVYKFSPINKEFLGEQTLDYTDKSPSGKFNIPANCTEVVPPTPQDNVAYVFNGTEWESKADYRGKTYWLSTAKYGDVGTEVKDLGELPSGATLTEPEQTLDEVKSQKLTELKSARDKAEVATINNFDFDEKSRDRLDIACKALTASGTTIEWTMADNSTATINAQNITDVFIASATRSNELHEKYRTLKEQVNACTTKTDVEKITW